VLGYLRDTQNYVQLAARGLTIWDVAPGRVERDLEQWKPIVNWAKLKEDMRSFDKLAICRRSGAALPTATGSRSTSGAGLFADATGDLMDHNRSSSRAAGPFGRRWRTAS
jgi:hypothetical protein